MNNRPLDLDEEIGLAEALFDNEAEWPDELAFNRGDILRILDQNPAGGLAEGWWICADRNEKRGIAPANRLKMLHNFVGTTSGRNNRIITPRRFGDVFLYGQPGNVFQNDEFFRPFGNVRPGVGATTTYDILPSKFRNFHLLHDSDHPFVLENGGDPFDIRPLENNSAMDSRNNYYSSIVRNVPIRVEGRKDVVGAEVGGQTVRKSPPPPPQRRHFYRTAPFTTTTSSEEEKLTNGAVNNVSASLAAVGNRTLYDAPSSLRPVGKEVRFADSSTTPNRMVTILNNSIGSDNGTLSDRSSSLSDSTNSGGRLSNGGNESYDVPSSILRNSGSSSAGVEPTTNNQTSKQKEITLTNLTSNLFNVGGGESLYDSPKNNSVVVTGAVVTNDVAATKINSINRTSNAKNAETTTNNGAASTTYDVLTSSQKNNRRIPTSSTSVNNVPSSSAINNDFDRVSVSSADSDYQELKQGAPSPYTTSSAALQRLLSVQQNLHITTTKLNNYVTKNWRRKEFLESHLYDIRLTCRHVVSTLKDYVDFCSGCFVNLSRGGGGKSESTKKFAHLLRPLRQSLTFLNQLLRSLESSGWTVSKFVRDASTGGNDNLDQFVAVTKQLSDDVRPVSTFVKSNASAMFDNNNNNNNHNNSNSTYSNNSVTLNGDGILQEEDLVDDLSDEKSSLFDDYDFVEGPSTSTSKTKQEKQNGHHGLTNGHHKNNVVVEEEKQVPPTSANVDGNASSSSMLNQEDKQILQFYNPQIDSHMECLSNAIDDFLAAVERNEPPKVFVGHSRFVILAAHKLVYIGDNLAHCLKNRDVAERMKRCSDSLCDVLKYCVTATKQASLQYPLVASVQAMVDSMVNVSHVAHELKLFVRQAASL